MRPTASIRSGSPWTSSRTPRRAERGRRSRSSPSAPSHSRTLRSHPSAGSGYNGDAGHGRGNHLHLSWNHSDTKPGRPARTVYTLRCPGSGGGESSGGGGDGGGKKGGKDGKGNGGGGLHPGGGKGDGGGGIQPRLMKTFEALAADPVIETGGVGLP